MRTEIIGTIIMVLAFAFSSFMAGRVYQYEIEKGYYEELQAIKKQWKPKRLIMLTPDTSSYSIMDNRYVTFTFPLDKANRWEFLSFDKGIDKMILYVE